ncbi:MAG: hypothetical protein QXP43_02535 [Nitrososphaerota archaeon]
MRSTRSDGMGGVRHLERRILRVSEGLRRLQRRAERTASGEEWDELEEEVWKVVRDAYQQSLEARRRNDQRASQAYLGISLKGLELLSRIRREREVAELRALAEELAKGGEGS